MESFFHVPTPDASTGTNAHELRDLNLAAPWVTFPGPHRTTARPLRPLKRFSDGPGPCETRKLNALYGAGAASHSGLRHLHPTSLENDPSRRNALGDLCIVRHQNHDAATVPLLFDYLEEA